MSDRYRPQGLQAPRAQRNRSYGGVFGQDATADDAENDRMPMPTEPYKVERGFLVGDDDTKTKGNPKNDAIPVAPRQRPRRMKAGGFVKPKPSLKVKPASIPKRSSAETKADSRPKTRPAARSRRK